MLYATSGDGASFDFADYGQLGEHMAAVVRSCDEGLAYYGTNPCGDPANEGGSLRSQRMETTRGPRLLNGAVSASGRCATLHLADS